MRYPVQWVYDDGGRRAAGFGGKAGDCVTRAIAIATGKPYRTVHDRLALGDFTQRRSRRMSARAAARKRRPTADRGIFTKRKWFTDYMTELGLTWVPTMGIGTGCRVHLRADELPGGRLIASCSKHLVAVVDGVIHDTHDPSRDGTRCVYGYWRVPDVG